MLEAVTPLPIPLNTPPDRLHAPEEQNAQNQDMGYRDRFRSVLLYCVVRDTTFEYLLANIATSAHPKI